MVARARRRRGAAVESRAPPQARGRHCPGGRSAPVRRWPVRRKRWPASAASGPRGRPSRPRARGPCRTVWSTKGAAATPPFRWTMRGSRARRVRRSPGGRRRRPAAESVPPGPAAHPSPRRWSRVFPPARASKLWIRPFRARPRGGRARGLRSMDGGPSQAPRLPRDAARSRARRSARDPTVRSTVPEQRKRRTPRR